MNAVANRRRIIALGPNPAWQKTLFFDGFSYGEVNRAADISCFAAGKGVNFVRAAGCHGAAAAEVLQFCGGANGDLLEADLRREGLSFHSIRTAVPTRCCTTCLDMSDSVMTELIEPSYAASGEEVAAMLDYLDGEIASGSVSAVACCGTLPGKTDPELYVRACRKAVAAGVPVLLDAFHHIDEILRLPGRVYLKINREELGKLTGVSGMEEGLKKLFASSAVPAFAAITDGPGKAFACDGRRMAVYTIPRLQKVVSPLGCGDTASAVLLSEIVSGGDLFTGFKVALAAASANAMSAMSGSFDTEDADRIAHAIEVGYREV